LRGADLCGAKLAGANLGGVFHDHQTRWPEDLSGDRSL
jgi:hypothetical protein